MEGEIEVMGRQGKKGKQLLDKLRGKQVYRKLKYLIALYGAWGSVVDKTLCY